MPSAPDARSRGINVCLETSGFCKAQDLERIFPFVDLFLYDYKAIPSMHKELTGGESTVILENLHMLDKLGGRIILRCPIVPDNNLCPEHINGIIEVAKGLSNLLEINLEPYHNIGVGKRCDLGISQEAQMITPPDARMMQDIARRIEEEAGVKTVVM